MTATFTPAARDIFAKQVLAHVACLDLNGAPHVTPVWVGLDGDDEQAAPASPASPGGRKKLLYDLVFDNGSAPAVKHSMRAGRDTNNPTQLSWKRDFGTLRLSSQDVGYGTTGEEGIAILQATLRSRATK